jgi:hypothetical protein
MRLSLIEHDLRTKLWCGPAALAAITGMPTSQVVEHIKADRRRRRKSPRVIGTTIDDVERMLRNVGYQVFITDVLYHPIDQPTFSEWLALRRPPGRAYLVMLERENEYHWVAVTRTHFADNSVGPIPVEVAPYRRSRVHTVLSVGSTK